MKTLRQTFIRLLFRTRWGILLHVAPASAVVLAAFIIPLTLLFVVSLWAYNPERLVATEPTLENYAKLLLDPFYRAATGRTLVMGALVSCISLVLGYLLAYVFARSRIRGKGLFMFLLLSPLFVSVVVRSFGWVVIFERGGPLNWLLMRLGIVSHPVTFLETMIAVVTGLLNVQLVFMVLPIYSSLSGIPVAYEEAAKTLGAKPITAFLRVTFPLSLPGVVSGWLLVFAMTVSSYVQPSVLGGARFFVLPTLLYSQLMNVLNWPFAAAIGFFLLVIALMAALLPTLVTQRLVGTRHGGGLRA